MVASCCDTHIENTFSFSHQGLNPTTNRKPEQKETYKTFHCVYLLRLTDLLYHTDRTHSAYWLLEKKQQQKKDINTTLKVFLMRSASHEEEFTKDRDVEQCE